jgi:hypothetical protein
MKNLRIKLLTLGVLATVTMSSMPVFAATNTETTNAITSTSTSTSKTPTIPGTIKTASTAYASTAYATKLYFITPNGMLGVKGSDGFDVAFSINSYDALVGYGYTTSGNFVHALQLALNHYGYGLDVDSQFGTNTYNALVDFQGRHSLTKDGICGPSTWSSLTNNF